MTEIALKPVEGELAGKLLMAAVDEFYPTAWFEWPAVAELRDTFLRAGVPIRASETSFDDDFPRQGD